MNKAVCDIMVKKKDLEMNKLAAGLGDLHRRATALATKIQSLDNYISEYTADLQSAGDADYDLHKHRAVIEFLGRLSMAKEKLSEARQSCNDESNRIKRQIRNLHTEQSKYQRMSETREQETRKESEKLERKQQEERFLGSFVRAQQAAK